MGGSMQATIKRSRLLLTLAALSLVFASCTGDAQTTTTTSSDAGTSTSTPTADTSAPDDDTTTTGAGEVEGPTQGGTLVLAVPADPTTLDPRNFEATSDSDVIENVYNRLVEINLETLAIEPSLASSWEISEDGLSIVFSLEQGVVFHDGRPFTAADVKWTIEEQQLPDQFRTTELLNRVEEVVIVDDHTVEFQMSEPDSTLFETLLDVWIRPDGWEYDPDNLIGTGPFRFVEWSRNSAVVLERNEDYWRPDLPYLDGVRYETVPDDSTRVLRLQNGEAHMLPMAPFTSVEDLVASGFVLALPPEGTGAFYDLRINVRNEPWSDVRVRQAMNYALDREAIAEALFGLYGPVSNTVPATSEFFNPDVPTYERDLDRARELLAEAGYPDGVDAGALLAHFDLGFDFEILAPIIQASAAEVGINLEIDAVDVNTAVDRYLAEEPDFDIWNSSMLPRPTTFDLINHAYGKGREVAQGSVDTMPEFFELLGQARSMNPDSDEYRAAIMELQAIALDHLPSIIVGSKPLATVTTEEVQGFLGHPQGRPNLEVVWLDE